MVRDFWNTLYIYKGVTLSTRSMNFCVAQHVNNVDHFCLAAFGQQSTIPGENILFSSVSNVSRIIDASIDRISETFNAHCLNNIKSVKKRYMHTTGR